MKFDPEIHHRRSMRLKGYDYSMVGAYFVTICTHNRESLFSDVGATLAVAQNSAGQENRNEIVLKTPGKIILKIWNKISQRFKNVRTDDLVIMPNHIHGILMIYDNKRVTARVTPTFGDIIDLLFCDKYTWQIVELFAKYNYPYML